MRDLEAIYQEVVARMAADNCQSWHAICLEAMRQAVQAYREELIAMLEQQD